MNPDQDAIVAAMQTLDQRGLNRGASGNISVRIAAGFLITPSGIAPEKLKPGDCVSLDADGEVLDAHGKPSSEWRFHKDIYAARKDLKAIVHVHSTYATALACLGRDLPPFHYMIAISGAARVKCAPYATFGTQTLSDHALEALGSSRVCLLANHGMIAAGGSLAQAMQVAIEIESLAQQYLIACQNGEPHLLDDDEMQRVIEKFKTYGAHHGNGET